MRQRMQAPANMSGFSIGGVEVEIDAEGVAVATTPEMLQDMLSHGFTHYELKPEEKKAQQAELDENARIAREAAKASDDEQMAKAAAARDAEEAEVAARDAAAAAAVAQGQQPPPVTVKVKFEKPVKE